MKRIIGILCGLFFFLFSFAQETFQKETYISSRGDTLLYRLLRPEVMKPDEKYPLVLFLHGAGERGNDNEYVERVVGFLSGHAADRQRPYLCYGTFYGRNGYI